MKKLLTGVTLLLITMVSLMPLAKAQKVPFSGTVVYDVKTVGDVPEQAAAMMPTESTLRMTPDKLLQVMHSSMMDIKTIQDATAQVSNMLMDMMGQKLNIRNTAAQLADQRKKLGMEVTIKLASETKNIAGYLCKRAIMTVKSNQAAESTSDIYYTEDIEMSQFNFGNTFPAVNGLPLEFTMNQGPFSIKMTAKSVKKENIPASEFVIPADFKQVTQEDLRQMFGGGGQ
jgi:GLPGLI family protein